MEGIKLDLKKIKVVTKYYVIVFVTNVRAFMGLIGYYQNYIKGYSQIVIPLFELIKMILCSCGLHNVKMHSMF